MIEIDVDGKSYAAELAIFALYGEHGCDMQATVKAYLETSKWADVATFQAKKRAIKVVQRAVEIGREMQCYELILTGGGGLRLPLGEATSVKPFDEVAKKVFRRFHKTLGKLELPGYFIEDRAGLGKPVCLERLQGRART